MLKFKIIPELDKNQKILQLAQTIWGKITIWLLFSMSFWLLQFHQNKYFNLSKGYIWDKLIILGIFIFFPKHKKMLLVLSSIYWLIQHNFVHWPQPLLKILGNVSMNQALVIQSIFIAIAVIWFFTWMLRRLTHGVAILLTLFMSALMLVGASETSQPMVAVIMGSLIIIGQYLWYWIFALKDPNFRYWQLLTFMPFWTWTILPIPKAWQYLNQTEAKDSLSLAIVELKAIKLILWAMLLAGVHLLIQTFINGEQTIVQKFFNVNPQPLITNLDVAVRLYQTDQALTFKENWLAVFLNFVNSIFYLAIGTHLMVSVIRLCGWQVKRNVYRCFEARSISDFFNRYYYYFKEMLVDIFFFPTYFTFFKSSPTLRLFFATLISAGLGNFLFHFSLDVSLIVHRGSWIALQNYGVYAFYCLILSLGIFISQWSRIHQKFQHPLWLVRTRMLLFFMLLNILIGAAGDISLAQYLNFIFGLFIF